MDIESRYQLLEKIGSGSYATVYRARDSELGRDVAVKQIHQQYLDDPDQLNRYWQEAQLLASLHHPNIVTIFDVFRDRGWLILELMQGDLSARMANRQMDLRALRTTLAHALRALKYLHARGIVHGDIKPSNLMIDHRRRIKIGDFGLARRVSDEEGSLLKGTTKYMAPEVVSEEFGEVGPASDLYSLGFTAYELMCGPNFESLFPGLSAFGRNKQMAWMMWHAAADRRLPDIHRVLEGVPDDLALVIQKMCHKDQAQRYHSAEKALEGLNVDIKVVKSDETGAEESEEPPAEDAQRKRRLMAIGAFSVSLLLSLLILFFPAGGGSGGSEAGKVTHAVVREVLPDRNTIVIEDVESGIPEEIDVARKPKIFLRNTQKNILLRELQPGDLVEFKSRSADNAAPVGEITASRPVSSRGRLKSIDLHKKQILVAVLEGETREDLPLYVPERAEIWLNGRRVALEDLQAGDRVTVSHLEDASGKGMRVVNKLEVHRRTEAAGFVSDVDLAGGRLTIQFGRGSSSSTFTLPLADECTITVQGQPDRELARRHLREQRRVKLIYDSQIREIIVSPSKRQVFGALLEADAAEGQLRLSTSEGKRLTFALTASSDVTLNRESAELADLRRNDALAITYEQESEILQATTVDAERPIRKDRWAVIIATAIYNDKSISPLVYAHRDAKLLAHILRSRYAFSADRLRMPLDPSRQRMEQEISTVLDAARSRTQVLIYISAYAYRDEDDAVFLAGRDVQLNRLSETGLSLNWLTRQLEACESDDKILLLDCWQVSDANGSASQPSPSEMFEKLPVPLESTAAIVHSQVSENGGETIEAGYGRFARYVAEGFSGRADRDRDLRITAAEIVDHLKSRMPTPSAQGKASPPGLLFGGRSGARP